MGRLIAMLAVFLAAAAPADDLSSLPDKDLLAIRALLQQVSDAVVAGDADALEDVFWPGLPEEERKRILARGRGEFRNTRYRAFSYSLPPETPADFRSVHEGERLEVDVLVPVSYEYETQTHGEAQTANYGETALRFRFILDGERWWIMRSDLVSIFAPGHIQQVFGRVFAGLFVLAGAIFFWIWMALDAWVRTGRGWHSVLILLTPPLGALIYFLTVYLRSQFSRSNRA